MSWSTSVWVLSGRVAMHEFVNNRLFFVFFLLGIGVCAIMWQIANLFGGVCQGRGPVLLQRLLRSGSCGENAKYCLSLWHGEVRGPSHWESVHMSPFCYLNKGSLPHLLLSASSTPPRPPFIFSSRCPHILFNRVWKKGHGMGGLFHKHRDVAADWPPWPLFL